MSSKDHDVEVPADELAREKSRRSKSERKERRDRDRDHDREKDRDPDRERRRHRSSRSSKSKLSEGSDTVSHTSSRRHRHRRERDSDEHRHRHHRDRAASTSDLASSHMTSTAATSILSDRISFPYPSFSKAHSKEAIVSRDSLALPRQDSPKPPTPEPTEGPIAEEPQSSKGSDTGNMDAPTRPPPSPPATDVDADKKAEEAAVNEETPAEPTKEEVPTEAPEEETPKVESPRHGTPKIRTPTEELPADEAGLDQPKSRVSSHSRSGSRNEERSRVSRRSGSSSQATYVKSSALRSEDKLRRSGSRASSSSHHSVHRTSSTRSRRRYDAADGASSPSSAQDSSPRTPTQAPFPHGYPDTKRETPSVIDVQDVDSNLHSKTATPASAFGVAPPPPPPPPALDIQDMPRVDYLLQNGGLAYTAPKNFLSVLPRQNGTRPSNPPLAGTDTLFAPFHNLLDQYNTVLGKQGSIAVATGHRSVARRLLDRLENVFSRDLPQHGCTCIMCDNPHEIHDGLQWGDVLEWVSGRIELPQWPPFDLAEIGTKAAEISGDVPPRPASPVQLDPDIAEEFREHYLRQSKKVRTAVDRWLSNTGETPVPPPQDVDDETLSFAILTNLDPEDRPYFNALISGSKELRSSVRAPTPGHKPRTDFLIKTGLALQRLYRLSQVPRDAESATYLIKNPHTHDLLVALSNINNSEWEILISGRFDGFLWSGADDDMPYNRPESRGPTPASAYYNTRTMSPGPRASSSFSSRNVTPFSVYSRGTTPASFVSVSSAGMPGNRQAVSNDEEMEMAAIAEIEREIYKGMETLEDAFEKLHKKAEVVRNALRQRGAGLMQNLQNRRRIDILSGPNSGNSQSSGYERPAWAGESDRDPGSDDDWAFDDVDIMPDDSASNISSSRHRRPKRRTERRTPAPINEEDED